MAGDYQIHSLPSLAILPPLSSILSARETARDGMGWMRSSRAKRATSLRIKIGGMSTRSIEA